MDPIPKEEEIVMKTKLRIASVLLVLCMLASCLASCETKEKDVDISKTVSSETSENVWVDPAPEMYKAAVEKIKSQKDFALDVEYTYSRIADLDENIEIGSIHVDNLAYGADGMASKSVKRVRYNDNDETTITETFANGKAYLDFEEESFVSEMTAEQYSERVFPSVLFDAALYSEIKTSDEKGKNGETVIIFSGAESVEKWAGADYSKLVSFSGKAPTTRKTLYNLRKGFHKGKDRT